MAPKAQAAPAELGGPPEQLASLPRPRELASAGCRGDDFLTLALSSWDALVTSYVIDTLADPAAAVRRAWELLAPGARHGRLQPCSAHAVPACDVPASYEPPWAVDAGGAWVNVGPLHWHDPALGYLRLSWEELKGLLMLHGFRLAEERVIRRIPYLGRLKAARGGWGFARGRDELLSGADSWHDAILFVAQKAPLRV